MLSHPAPCTAHIHPRNPHLITAPHLSHLPTPLDIYQSKAIDLVPWQSRYANQDSPFALATDNSWTIGSFIYTSLACLTPDEQSVAQGELLGLSLLLEDVLQTSDLAKTTPSIQGVTVDTSHAQIPSVSILQSPGASGTGGKSTKISRQNSYEPASKVPVTPTSRQASYDPMHIGSGLSKTKQPSSSLSSSNPPISTLTSLHVLVPPLEGLQLMKQFLAKSSQLEVLKLEWGKKMLKLHSVVKAEHVELLESAYRDKVLNWVRKMVAKQQQKDMARMQAEAVSLN